MKEEEVRMERKQVTMKDIAERLDVSIVTVSKALAGKEGVGDELRKRIEDTAKELGYVARTNSKVEQMVNTNVAIVIAEHFIHDDHSFYFRVYQKLLSALAERNYVGIMEIISDEDERAGKLPNVVRMKSVEQVIVLGEMRHEFLEGLNKAGISMLFFDFEDEEFDVESVVGDNINGGFQLTRFLIKNGYHRIGFVGSYKRTRSILDRYMGYRKYLILRDQPFEPEWVIEDRNEAGLDIELILPDREHMPDAFVCNCDLVAHRLIRTLEQNGYQIPQDIAVVGYDDYSYGAEDGHALTTYHVDTEEMVRSCVHIIDQKARNKRYHRGTTMVHGELIVRDTVGKK